MLDFEAQYPCVLLTTSVLKSGTAVGLRVNSRSLQFRKLVLSLVMGLLFFELGENDTLTLPNSLQFFQRLRCAPIGSVKFFLRQLVREPVQLKVG